MIIDEKEMHGYKIKIFQGEKEIKFPVIETITEDVQKVDIAIKEIPKKKWSWKKWRFME